jgi:hypothetical protein
MRAGLAVVVAGAEVWFDATLTAGLESAGPDPPAATATARVGVVWTDGIGTETAGIEVEIAGVDSETAGTDTVASGVDTDMAGIRTETTGTATVTSGTATEPAVALWLSAAGRDTSARARAAAASIATSTATAIAIVPQAPQGFLDR